MSEPGKLSYTVAVTFCDQATATEWLEWLKGNHLREVVEAGKALRAEVARLDSPSGVWRYEARYWFASREAFAAYERDHAPRLRAEGLAKFPTTRGVSYQRSTAEVVVEI